MIDIVCNVTLSSCDTFGQTLNSTYIGSVKQVLFTFNGTSWISYSFHTTSVKLLQVHSNLCSQPKTDNTLKMSLIDRVQQISLIRMN